MDITELVRPELLSMVTYTPIEPIEVLQQQTGKRVIKLDGNENPYGCSPKVYPALAHYSYYHIYPDPQQRILRQALEKYAGISLKHIVCGSGSDELIDLVLRLFLQPGDEVINCPPTFGMYPFSTGVCGGRVIEVPRKSENFALDIDGIKKAVTGKTKVIFITSPNNPTGNSVTEQEILALLDTGRIVVVDEAYFEFSFVASSGKKTNLRKSYNICGKAETMANLVTNYPNLIVLRSFSKWAGLAGLRIGYGFFPEQIAGWLMKIKPPYNVNMAAQAAVLASLEDIDYLRDNVARIVAERERLVSRLEKLEWLKPYPSSSNFILCHILEGEAKEIWQRLRREGIFIRYYPDNPMLNNYLRISVGKPEDSNALLEALTLIATNVPSP